MRNNIKDYESKTDEKYTINPVGVGSLQDTINPLGVVEINYFLPITQVPWWCSSVDSEHDRSPVELSCPTTSHLPSTPEPTTFFFSVFSRNFDERLILPILRFPRVFPRIFFREEFPPLVCAPVTKRWRRGGSPRTSANRPTGRTSSGSYHRSRFDSKSGSFSMLVVV